MFGFHTQNIFRKRKFSDWGGEIEPQEILLDSLSEDKFSGEREDTRLEVPVSSRSMGFLYGTFCVIALIFLGQALYLQVFASSQLTARAQHNALRNIPLASNRGVIYDKNMNQLVFNEPSFNFVCDRQSMTSISINQENIAQKIANLFGIPLGDVREALQNSFSPRVLVAKDISHDNLVAVNARISEFSGCAVESSDRRAYKNGSLFSSVIGYTSKVSLEEIQSHPEYSSIDQVGKSGIEKAFEKELQGIPGKIVVQRDSFGKIIKEDGEVPSVQGESVVLWLDAGLQEEIGRAFTKVFETTGAKKGAAVALDPRTGGVLALASFPGFDNNLFAGGISSANWAKLMKDPAKPMFNRAMSGIGYPTGSVIKPLVGIAALEEGVIAENTKIFAPLELCVKNIYTKKDECFRDWTFHGTTDIKRAIAESVNTFFYIIGGGQEEFAGLGPNRIKQWLLNFGWGEPTGIDIAGEGFGVLPEFDNNWRLGDTYHFSIGQGPFAVTPLQVATAFSAIANGGTLYEPQTAKALVDESREVIKEFAPKIKKQNIADSTILEIIREGMRQTVTAGSATGWLDKISVDVATKTGTAQTGKRTVDGRDYLYSWTVSFAPIENPEIVFVAVVEDIKEGQVGALPITKDVLEWYFNER